MTGGDGGDLDDREGGGGEDGGEGGEGGGGREILAGRLAHQPKEVQEVLAPLKRITTVVEIL